MFSTAHGGRNDVTSHVGTIKHKEMAKLASISKSVSSFFMPSVQTSTIRAETVWSMLIAKHNLAFLSSDHANKLFKAMFETQKWLYMVGQKQLLL